MCLKQRWETPCFCFSMASTCPCAPQERRDRCASAAPIPWACLALPDVAVTCLQDVYSNHVVARQDFQVWSRPMRYNPCKVWSRNELALSFTSGACGAFPVCFEKGDSSFTYLLLKSLSLPLLQYWKLWNGRPGVARSRVLWTASLVNMNGKKRAIPQQAVSQ